MHTTRIILEKEGDNGLPDYHQILGHFNFTGVQKLFWKAVIDRFGQLRVLPDQLSEIRLFLRNTNVTYCKELKESRLILVELWVCEKSKTSITFKSVAYFLNGDQHKGEKFSETEFTFVAINAKGKPTRLPQQIADLPIE